MSAEREAARPVEKPYRSLCLCLTCRDRTLLYQRIDTRCDRMMQSGILEEAKLVYDHRDTYRTAAQAIGYKEFFPYFEGTADLESCLAHLKQASRNYAKRQLTWVPPPDGRCVALPGRRKPGTAGGRTDRSVPGGKQRLKCSNNIVIYKR